MAKTKQHKGSSLFPVITEKRYADYPRRYLNEYHFGNRHVEVGAKGSCATLASARKHAVNACDKGFCSVVRIFDRMKGEYLFTYKQSTTGVIRHEGYVR